MFLHVAGIVVSLAALAGESLLVVHDILHVIPWHRARGTHSGRGGATVATSAWMPDPRGRSPAGIPAPVPASGQPKISNIQLYVYDSMHLCHKVNHTLLDYAKNCRPVSKAQAFCPQASVLTGGSAVTGGSAKPETSKARRTLERLH